MRKLFTHLLVLIPGCLVSVFVQAAQAMTPAEIPTRLFAQMPYLYDAELSHDGTHIAYFLQYEGRTHLAIESLIDTAKKTIIPPVSGLSFSWLHWANDDRLLFSMLFKGTAAGSDEVGTRLWSIDKTGDDLQAIIKPGKRKLTGSLNKKNLPRPRVQDQVINWNAGDSDHILVSLDEDFDSEVEVRRVNVYTGAHEIVRKSDAGIQHWLVNASGDVRLGYGFTKSEFTAKIKAEDGYWIRANNTDWWDNNYRPLAFTENPNIVYVRGPNAQGMSVIRTMRIADGAFIKTLFENERYDADGLIYDPVSRRPIGVTYTDNQRRDKYFVPEFSRMQKSLEKALPGMNVYIVSTSKDRQQVLAKISSNTDPGSYYHWDRAAKQLNMFSEIMPDLNPELLSPPRAVSFVARDKAVIPAYLTLPKGKNSTALPAVILPHGGPHERSDAQYSFLTQYLVSRGYAVLQPNFRGSDGYGRKFRESGTRQWGGLMQDDVADGAKWLVDEGIADAQRLCIVGWSYGGYAAAMGAIKSPDLYKCVASINGVLDLPRLVSEENQYTGGTIRTKSIGLEGETLVAVSPFHQAERITVPMLIIQATDDARAQGNQAQRMYRRLKKLNKPVEFVPIDSGGHTMNNENARTKILTSLEKFLGEHTRSRLN